MNTNKIAFISASWLIITFSSLCGFAFAADSPIKKPAASQPIAKPGIDGMMCDHKRGPMMHGNESGMLCEHKDCMKCGHEGGMMCDHKGGMMGDHKGGMMGGHGAGMMESRHMNDVMSLDLNEEQRSKINKLSDELRHNNWATKGLIMDESAKLRDLYDAEKRDPSAIGKEYQKIFDLKRQMIEATITTQNRIEELLTPDQRIQLKNMPLKKRPKHNHPMH